MVRLYLGDSHSVMATMGASKKPGEPVTSVRVRHSGVVIITIYGHTCYN